MKTKIFTVITCIIGYLYLLITLQFIINPNDDFLILALGSPRMVGITLGIPTLILGLLVGLSTGLLTGIAKGSYKGWLRGALTGILTAFLIIVLFRMRTIFPDYTDDKYIILSNIIYFSISSFLVYIFIRYNKSINKGYSKYMREIYDLRLYKTIYNIRNGIYTYAIVTGLFASYHGTPEFIDLCLPKIGCI